MMYTQQENLQSFIAPTTNENAGPVYNSGAPGTMTNLRTPTVKLSNMPRIKITLENGTNVFLGNPKSHVNKTIGNVTYYLPVYESDQNNNRWNPWNINSESGNDVFVFRAWGYFAKSTNVTLSLDEYNDDARVANAFNMVRMFENAVKQYYDTHPHCMNTHTTRNAQFRGKYEIKDPVVDSAGVAHDRVVLRIKTSAPDDLKMKYSDIREDIRWRYTRLGYTDSKDRKFKEVPYSFMSKADGSIKTPPNYRIMLNVKVTVKIFVNSLVGGQPFPCVSPTYEPYDKVQVMKANSVKVESDQAIDNVLHAFQSFNVNAYNDAAPSIEQQTSFDH